jgi:hypothetical protein
MWTESSMGLALARAIQADRLAGAQRWRNARSARRVPGRIRRPDTFDRAGAHRDLAAWLTSTGELVAVLGPDELVRRRRALRVVVDELLAAGRDAELDLDLDGEDDPIVLARALGWLAGRTAGRSIPLSRTRRRRLARSVRRLTLSELSGRAETAPDLRSAA